MTNTWKWYIVVVCTEDWYTLYQHTQVVKARSVKEAQRRAIQLGHYPDYDFAQVAFGPFDDEPKEC